MTSKDFLSNIKEAFPRSKDPDRAAQGLVPTILILAGFAVVAILVVTWIGNSIALKASVEANCIAQVDGFSSLNGEPSDKCIGNDSTGANIIGNQINSQKGGRF